MARDNITSTLEDVGAVVLANACGPCIGQVRVILALRSIYSHGSFAVEANGQEGRGEL
jgi:aconitase A